MPFTPPGEYPYVNDSAPGEGDGDIVYAEIVNVIMAYLQDVLPIDISEASAADIYHAVLLGRDAPESHPADAITVDASGFNGNLTTGDDDVQKVAQKVDDLSLGGTYTDENARDAIAAALVAGSGVTITPNDGADTITIDATGSYTDEMARDAIGTALTAGTGITITPDDGGNTNTVLGTAPPAGTGLTITPNDGSDIITVASSITQYTDENARDAVGTALVAGTGISVTVNDGADTITITNTDSTTYAPATRTVGTSLGTSGTVDLDMASVHGTIQKIVATGDLTFTTSNRSAGREVTVLIGSGGSTRTLTWPSWLAVGGSLPTSLTSGKSLVVSVTFVDTTDASAIAAAAVQL